ncbi:hypothetical protein FNAPI_4502 [Fusarium napiforme]|uniref:Uncharacterized protein n=1 Tax=Fusarium napiforme TaxID=42672 RepID=A0A8H5JV15_9HYPO|nr:hypothetical protein FNAPI_4502 [Fusarium napiforme]
MTRNGENSRVVGCWRATRPHPRSLTMYLFAQHALDAEMGGTGIIARTSYSCDELNGRKQKAAEARLQAQIDRMRPWPGYVVAWSVWTDMASHLTLTLAICLVVEHEHAERHTLKQIVAKSAHEVQSSGFSSERQPSCVDLFWLIWLIKRS